ncbi:MAG: hypothetical protein DWQ36_08700 [Acidobacteria bacterium]|nr:MAG: hypothetical protein DWQ30_22700 [Acidobacteriota bacterium]REK08722.1 MAG: hypothetical protein DWQ36_08700 [Acidobacteriota bacterium]
MDRPPNRPLIRPIRGLLTTAAAGLMATLSLAALAQDPSREASAAATPSPPYLVHAPTLHLEEGWLQRQKASSLGRWSEGDAERLRRENLEVFTEAFFAALEEQEIEFDRLPAAPGDAGRSASGDLTGDAFEVVVAVTDFDLLAPHRDERPRSARYASTLVEAKVTFEVLHRDTGELIRRIEDRSSEGLGRDSVLRRAPLSSDHQAVRRLAAGWAELLASELHGLTAADS